MSKIMAAVNKITGKDQDTDAAYDAIASARKTSDGIARQVEHKNDSLLAETQKLNHLTDAAVTDESKLPACERQQAKVDQVERELKVLRLTHKASLAKIIEAEAAFNAAGKGKQRKAIERKNADKLKAAQGIEEHGVALVQHWHNYFSAAAKQVALLPNDLGNKGGTMCRVNEIIEAMALELRRLNPLVATIRSEVAPLPGQDMRSIISIESIKSFVEVTEAANAHILRLFDEDSSPPKPRPVAEPIDSPSQPPTEPARVVLNGVEGVPEGPIIDSRTVPIKKVDLSSYVGGTDD